MSTVPRRSPEVEYGVEFQRRLFARLAKGAPWYRLIDPRLPEDDPSRDVIVKLGYTLNGRPVISGVLLGAEADDELTGRVLRRISLEGARDLLAQPKYWSGSSRMRETRPRWGRGRPTEPIDHKQIAADYLESLRLAPGAPMQRLGKLYRKSPVTMRRHVRRARAMGLID
jgi:hypothetical protein